jgi:PelA/Pel-15E family pectate lyase
MVRGRRTVWCAQHDEVTLAPAPARKYELVSLSGHESVGIVRFLMSIDHPDNRVIDAVESAIAWFNESKLTGIEWIEKADVAKPKGYDRVVIKDPRPVRYGRVSMKLTQTVRSSSDAIASLDTMSLR